MLESDPDLQGLYIMLDRVDVHCIWVSQAVLSLLPGDLPDVPGGEIVRDPGMGVFCDNAMDVVMAVWPRPGPEKKKDYVRSAMKDLHSVGLVGMHDAGVTPAELKLYEEMASDEEAGWSLRVYAMIECKERNTFCPEAVRKVEMDNGLLFVRSVKLFAGISPSHAVPFLRNDC
jgi:predicted amidohydrolase YtcJ